MIKRLLLFLLCVLPSAGQNVCSVRITVADPKGSPVTVPVSLRMDDGTLVGTEQTIRGVAEFCDVGWGTFSVTVGGESCGQVVVKHLYISWGATLEVPVMYRNCHGFLITGGGCALLVRVKDARGPVPNAQVRWKGASNETTTDRYGRAMLGIKFGDSGELLVAGDGYEPQSRSLECSRSKVQIEENVQLLRAPGRSP